MLKKTGKLLLKLLITFAALVVAGYVLLVLAYCIPVDRMDSNLAISYDNFAQQGEYPYIIANRRNSLLDNFTDEIILLEAVNPREESPLVDALRNPFIQTTEENTMASIIKYDANVDGNLYRGGTMRYWHGYLIFIKPLLYLMDYSQIKYVLMMTNLALFTIAIVFMSKRKARGVVPLFCYFLFIVPVTVIISLQFSTMNLLTLAQLAVMAVFYDKYKQGASNGLWVIHFFVVGCLTAYFDFLTYPVVGFCVPFIYLMIEFGDELLKSALSLLKCGVAWCIGYLLYWFSKWLIATAVTGEDVISEGYLKTRARIGGEGFGYGETMQRVFSVCNKYFIALAIVYLLACIVYCIVKRQKLKLQLLPVFAFVVLVPFAWFYVARNHTYIHFWFSFRNAGATVFAIAGLGDYFRRIGDKSCDSSI